MAEARISVTFTPAEFDQVRDAIQWVQKNQDSVARDTHTARPIRDQARQDAYLLGQILSKLK
jgi:hypothetical protein